MITPQYLLEGAVYALEQCGILLRDAAILYNQGSYSTAVVLAAFAREEMGRSLILRELRRDVVNNVTSITLRDIRQRCDDHVKKQEYAQLSVTQRVSSNQGQLAELVKIRIHSHPQSDEWKSADKELNEITERQKRRTPNKRHNERMDALYVEPNEFGTHWNRPREKSQEVAMNFIMDAVNDYAGQYDRIQNGYIQYSEPELFESARLLCFAISGVNVILLGPKPSSG